MNDLKKINLNTPLDDESEVYQIRGTHLFFLSKKDAIEYNKKMKATK